MAVIFADQSETGSVAWLQTVGGLGALTTPLAGPWSQYSIGRLATNNLEGIGLWDASVSEFYGQCRYHTLGTGGADPLILGWRSQNNVVSMQLGMDAAMRWTLNRAGTTLGTSTTVFNVGQWYYLQWRIVTSDTVGIAVLKVDGTTEIDLSNQDTRADAGANGDKCNRIEIASSSIHRFEDIVINDTTDTDNVTYPDRISIEALMPNAAGDVTGLSRGGTDSGSNFGQTDERPPNDATDYVFDSVVNDYDLYNLPATRWDSVSAVLLALRAQNSDAGAGSLAHMVKVDTDASGTADTENQGADVALSTSWVYHSKIYNRQPGATSWSAAKVNALQAGVKVR